MLHKRRFDVFRCSHHESTPPTSNRIPAMRDICSALLAESRFAMSVQRAYKLRCVQSPSTRRHIVPVGFASASSGGNRDGRTAS